MSVPLYRLFGLPLLASIREDYASVALFRNRLEVIYSAFFGNKVSEQRVFLTRGKPDRTGLGSDSIEGRPGGFPYGAGFGANSRRQPGPGRSKPGEPDFALQGVGRRMGGDSMTVNELRTITRRPLLRVLLRAWAAARMATPSLSRANSEVDGGVSTQYNTVVRATCRSCRRTL
jgi:hypothetical protein